MKNKIYQFIYKIYMIFTTKNINKNYGHKYYG